MLPLNIVIPATKSDAATLFLGATDVARSRTPEWMSYGHMFSWGSNALQWIEHAWYSAAVDQLANLEGSVILFFKP
jgi:hypothetical protein